MCWKTGEVRRAGESRYIGGGQKGKMTEHGDELDEGLERCVGTLGRWGWAREFLGSGGWNYGLSLVWRKVGVGPSWTWPKD